jgi:hypothetical protein
MFNNVTTIRLFREPITIGTAAILGGGQLASQGINALVQSGMNKKTREWNEKMYGMQRQHSLQDWQMQNAYNSPEQQMARLKAAGLNPHLIYGGGPGNVSQPVRSTDTKSWNPTAPQFDLGGAAKSALFGAVDLELKNIQRDRIAELTQVARQQALNQASQTAKNVQETAKSKFQLDQANALQSYVLEAARLGVKQQEANISSTLTNTQRTTQQIVTEALMQQPNLKLALADIDQRRANIAKTEEERYNIRQDTRNKERAGILQQIEIDLREKGINPNDPMYMRVLGQAIDKPFEELKNWWNKIWK